MVEKKAPAADKAKAKPAVKKSVSKAIRGLAFGKVKFRPFLWHGKWRFINKNEVEKAKKQKLAKIAKLKEQGITYVEKVSIHGAERPKYESYAAWRTEISISEGIPPFWWTF